MGRPEPPTETPSDESFWQKSPPDLGSNTKENHKNLKKTEGTYLVVHRWNNTTYSTNIHGFPENAHTKYEETHETYKIVLDKHSALSYKCSQ